MTDDKYSELDKKLREASALIDSVRWAISNIHTPDRCLDLFGTDMCGQCDGKITLYAHKHECKTT